MSGMVLTGLFPPEELGALGVLANLLIKLAKGLGLPFMNLALMVLKSVTDFLAEAVELAVNLGGFKSAFTFQHSAALCSLGGDEGSNLGGAAFEVEAPTISLTELFGAGDPELLFLLLGVAVLLFGVFLMFSELFLSFVDVS